MGSIPVRDSSSVRAASSKRVDCRSMWDDPSTVDTALDSRAVSFENPEGARGAGGQAAGGRKGAPSRWLRPGETVQLCDLRGPGRVRHFWMTFPPAAPEVMRAMRIEAFYNG